MLARCGFALLLLLSTACGATLTRGPTGWHESDRPYSIAPLTNGDLLPPGWKLARYSERQDGFRRDNDDAPFDLELRRREDDGVMVVLSYFVPEEDRQKRPEVLAERWLDRYVQQPRDDDSAISTSGVVPTTSSTSTASFGLHSISATTLYGRNVQTDSRESFAVPGGDAVEVTTTLAPSGSPPDRRLYLAVLRQANGERYAVVAYGNTPSMFERGLPDAIAFAHRVHF
jgi:hypothetical protein